MKDCTTCKYGYEDERLGIPMCHHPKRFSEDCVDFNMHKEKETKESRKPISLDFEQELYKRFGMVKDFTLGMRIAQAFYDLGCTRTAEKYDEIEYNRQRAEKSVPNDLEEAAEDYAYNEGYQDPEYYNIVETFIAAAKWDREQMMQGAVEYEVGMHGEPIKITFDKYVQRARGIFPGDKVRIIIVKEN